MRLLALVAMLAAAAAQPLLEALFGLREMDMHLHAGLERDTDMNAWLNLAVADGRRVFVLLDHLELYRRPGCGPAAHKALMAEFDAAARRPGILVFKGWEVYEGELDTGLEPEPLRMAEVIGFHISPNNGRKAPDGAALIRRVRQIKEAQKQFPVPMIVFHPFTMRLENLQRAGKAHTVAEYRFFQPGEQRELIELLKGGSVYIEISNSTARYFADPACRQALIEDIRPLAEAGVQFTVSTDNHSTASAKTPFRPEQYAEARARI
jgi:hypothetical protein